MEGFIKMNVGNLLELQRDLKKIYDFKGELQRDDIDLFKENVEFFADISADIECKLNELLED